MHKSSTDAIVPFALTIPVVLAGKRLDAALAELLPQYSRARLQNWIKDGDVALNAQPCRAKDRVQGGEHVTIIPRAAEELADPAQDIPLHVIYEDESLLVIDKPAGLVVHPAAGNRAGTLVNALLYHFPALSHLPRAGLVHRLDKDTSGLLVIAKHSGAQRALAAQLAARTVKRTYLAVVNGTLTGGGRVDAPLGRHPVDRQRMAVVTGGRPAITHYRLAERFRAHTLLRVNLETGRTHQIRVHLAHIGHPLVGDGVYGGRLRLPRGASASTLAALQTYRRQALHAHRLELMHPEHGEPIAWEAPPPSDLQALIAALRRDVTEATPLA